MSNSTKKPKICPCKRLPLEADKAQIRAAHKAKMTLKATRPRPVLTRLRPEDSASLNRRTGLPHEHAREISRRLSQR